MPLKERHFFEQVCKPGSVTRKRVSCHLSSHVVTDMVNQPTLPGIAPTRNVERDTPDPGFIWPFSP